MKKEAASWWKLAPAWAVSAAADFRCLWRRWRYGLGAPYKQVTRAATLVIAPHPDDETFGCGALISMKRQIGAPVRVVFLTNGENVASVREEKKESVVSARHNQAVTACRHLGVDATEIRWLNLPDGKLPRFGQPGFDEAVSLLTAQLMEVSPAEIFCPHPLDNHSDHLAASDMARESVRLSRKSCGIIHYPIWMWYHASFGLGQRLGGKKAWQVDGSAVKSKKLAAISTYLDAPKATNGMPYCGKLPWGFLWNFRRRSELFFTEPPQG